MLKAWNSVVIHVKKNPDSILLALNSVGPALAIQEPRIRVSEFQNVFLFQYNKTYNMIYYHMTQLFSTTFSRTVLLLPQKRLKFWCLLKHHRFHFSFDRAAKLI